MFSVAFHLAQPDLPPLIAPLVKLESMEWWLRQRVVGGSRALQPQLPIRLTSADTWPSVLCLAVVLESHRWVSPYLPQKKF